MVLLATTGCGYLPEVRGQFRALAPVWTAKMHVVAGPVAVGDTVVVFATARPPSELEAVGLDPTTGKPRWRVPTTPSIVTPSVPLRIVHDGSTVYLMVPQPGLATSPRAMLTAVDAATGRQRWKTRPAEFSDVPQFCDDTRATLCATAEAVVGGRYRNGLLRVDAPTGAEQSWPHDPRLLRRLSHDVFHLDTGADHAGVGSVDAAGRVRWQAPAATLAGPGATPNEGWTVIPAGDLHVASFGFPPRARTEESVVVDVSRTATIGLERSTGRRRWIDKGSDLSCGDSFTAPPEGVYLRCRLRGVGTAEGFGPFSFTGLDVTVERFDPATGKALWQWHAGNTPGLAGGTSPTRPRLSANEYAVEDATRKVVALDVRTGRRRPLDAAAVGWCLQPNGYANGVPYGEEKLGVTRAGVNHYYPCRTNHGRVRAVPPSVHGIVTTVRGRDLWVDSEGLHAAEAP